MPHLHTGPGERDFTATAYIVHQDHVLLHMHRKLNRWDGPGGHVEWDQDPLEALYAEIKQEAGISDAGLELIATNSLQRVIGHANSYAVPTPFDIDVHPIPMPDGRDHRHIDLAYAFRSRTADVTPEPGESQVWEWMNEERLLDITDQTTVNSLTRSLFALKLARGEV